MYRKKALPDHAHPIQRSINHSIWSYELEPGESISCDPHTRTLPQKRIPRGRPPTKPISHKGTPSLLRNTAQVLEVTTSHKSVGLWPLVVAV